MATEIWFTQWAKIFQVTLRLDKIQIRETKQQSSEIKEAVCSNGDFSATDQLPFHSCLDVSHQ